ncbi:DMT family transporter [Pasteurellaceae bacterium USgator11]|nr:DMT family transporter [Pasteurellaceae bacterium USgator41]TNG95965.1 DMT family transporter [Pasteurellaceae bacterium UScroc12]TNG95986.1 DMT family transporter [Pasteurellaceae bacterium UScroc31]TNH02277.1 DMT family transporter [Pasteurellaceae bacterium USgator11]
MPSAFYGYLGLLLASLFWGGNFMFGKMVSAEIPPIILNFSRWFPAAIILLLLFHRQLKPCLPIIRRYWLLLTALGVLGIIFFPVFLYQGLLTTTALNASIYLAAVPMATLLLNHLIFRDPIQPTMLIGAILSFIGVLYLLVQGEPSNILALNINSGDIWAIGSALSWAVYCAIVRLKPPQLINSVFVTSLVTIGVLLFSPIYLYSLAQGDGAVYRELSTTQWQIVLYLIIFPSILSYIFWNYGISIVGSAKGASFTNIVPLFAAALSIIILREPIHLYHIISSILIICGLVLCNRKVRSP